MNTSVSASISLIFMTRAYVSINNTRLSTI